MTQEQFCELFDRLQRVGLGGDPTFRTRLMAKLDVCNHDRTDPTFRRLTDAQLIAHAWPLAEAVDRDMTQADRRTGA